MDFGNLLGPSQMVSCIFLNINVKPEKVSLQHLAPKLGNPLGVAVPGGGSTHMTVA